MYAQYNKRKNTLDTMGITEEILKEGILKKFNVDSRAELTEAQYVEVREALTGEFPKWITDLAPKQPKSKTETEQDKDTEGDPQS